MISRFRKLAFSTLKARLPSELKRRLKASAGAPDMRWSLERMKNSGFRPRTIIDVGAYVGQWTRLAKQVFPSSRVLMVEPQTAVRSRLESLVEELAEVQHAPTALAATAGDHRPLYGEGSGCSLLQPAQSATPASQMVQLTTLDEVARQYRFLPPDFVKIDVQGCALDVLRGGTECLAGAEVVLIEVDLLPLYEGAGLFHEVSTLMAACGFKVHDICGFIRRPFDQALWEMDVVFARCDSPLVCSQRWN